MAPRARHRLNGRRNDAGFGGDVGIRAQGLTNLRGFPEGFASSFFGTVFSCFFPCEIKRGVNGLDGLVSPVEFTRKFTMIHRKPLTLA
jgi:hypothetical protein